MGGAATRMAKYLDRSESLEVDIKELECFLLAPEEAGVDIGHVALHAPRNRRTRLRNDVLLQRVAPGGGNEEAWRESKGKGFVAMTAARDRDEQFF